MKRLFLFFLLVLLFFSSRSTGFPHCEIPCGIYNDEMRFSMIAEHIQTTEKAMKQIMELSNQSSPNMNQIVRWVVNKEKHAEDIQHIISQYFLTQRIKLPAEENPEALKRYNEKISLCHQILVYAMKTKQTTVLANVGKLKSAVQLFKKAYFDKK